MEKMITDRFGKKTIKTYTKRQITKKPQIGVITEWALEVVNTETNEHAIIGFNDGWNLPSIWQRSSAFIGSIIK